MFTFRQSRVLTQLTFGSLLTLVGAVAGCLSTEDNRPTEAHITVTGAAVSPLQLVVSTDFFEQVIDGTELVAVLNTSDTTSVTPPFERTVALNALGSVLVRLIQPDSIPSDITMEVLLDGRLEYSQPATLSEGGSIEYRFTFRAR